MEQKVLRVSTAVVVGALVLRLLGAVSWDFTLSARAASWLLFMQTGKMVHQDNLSATEPTDTAPTLPPETTPTVPLPTIAPTITPTLPTLPALPTFAPEDAADLAVSGNFPWQADIAALLSKPLIWDLTGSEPTVLIVHAHGSESFTGGDYVEDSPYHTLDNDHNMISVGAYLTSLLEAAGIGVIHDTAIHDNPSYDSAYINSRKSVQEILKEYPSIRLVLDLHRDAYEDAAGNQIAHTVFSQGEELAPLMFVVGTDYGGYTHPGWQENLSIALKLQAQLEAFCPGICRNLSLRSQRYNQDLSSGALLVEVGASGNTLAQAKGAAKMLAEAIISLARGSQ